MPPLGFNVHGYVRHNSPRGRWKKIGMSYARTGKGNSFRKEA